MRTAWGPILAVVVVVALAGCLSGGGGGGKEGKVIEHFSNPPTIGEPETGGNASGEGTALVALNTTITRVAVNGSVVLADAGAPPRRLANISIVGRGASVVNQSARVAGADSACVEQVAGRANETIQSRVLGEPVLVVRVVGSGQYRAFFLSSGKSVAQLLVANGYAVHTGAGAEPEEQRQARQQQRGIWQCVA